MALIQCPECHREVSDQADKCPHCGYAVRQKDLLSDAALDDQTAVKLANEGKIAAIKFYRDHRLATSLADAKDHVERLAATRPSGPDLPQDSANGAKSAGCFSLFIFVLLCAVFWVTGCV